MVQVPNKFSLLSDRSINVGTMLSLLRKCYSQESFRTIEGAFNILLGFGGKQCSYHKSYFDYGVEMASILLDLQADENTIAAALLFELNCKQHIGLSHIHENCGEEVTRILEGTREMSAIRELHNSSPDRAQVDAFRKMILTIVEDVRIVLVKLADRVCVIRNSKHFNEEYRSILSKEILEIYAPLASRLGLAKTKWELEDRAFYSLYPNEYKKIAKTLANKRFERESYIDNVILKLKRALSCIKINSSVFGRVKHIYSIWSKLQKKNSAINAMYDIRAIRVLVNSLDDCYKVLSIIHDIWEPITSEFVDYIVSPKRNGYQSIHTIVYGPSNLTLEVQIRTYQMHRESEIGICAHWRYKDGVRYDPSYEAKVNWLRSFLDWKIKLTEKLENNNLLQKINDSRVYVFTLQGDVISLNTGSTVLDFAYTIHTMVGHRTKGAKINDRIVPLTTKLSHGDQIEVILQKEPQPSLDWANPRGKFIYLPKFRSCVSRWFRRQNKKQNAILGKYLVSEKLKSYDILEINYLEIANHFNFKDEETLFSCIKTGSIRFNQVLNYILEKYKKIHKSSDMIIQSKAKSKKGALHLPSNLDLMVYGLDNLLYCIAGCCKPLKGDKIIGYLTRSRGVSIHHCSCIEAANLKKSYPERIIKVHWGKS